MKKNDTFTHFGFFGSILVILTLLFAARLYFYDSSSFPWNLNFFLINQLLPFVVFSALFLGAIDLYIVKLRKKRLMNDLPTSRTLGVFMGLVELKGKAVPVDETLLCWFHNEIQFSQKLQEPWCADPTADGKTEIQNCVSITSHFAREECLFYHWTVEEERSDGKNRHWETIQEECSSAPFGLEDESGSICVFPDGADTDCEKVYEKEEYGVSKRRYTEYILRKNASLYLLGPACFDEELNEPVIRWNETASTYLISTKSEEDASRALAWSAFGAAAFGALVLTLGTVFLADSVPKSCFFSLSGFFASMGFYILLVLGIYIYECYASLVALQNYVKQGKSNLDVQFRRRAELIPNLIAVVNGMKTYENQIQPFLSALRSGKSGLSELHALCEGFPELSAEENFEKLMLEIENTETKISFARTYYNDIATQFNTRLQTVPDGFFGWAAGLKPMEILKIVQDSNPSEKLEQSNEQSNN